MVGMAAHARRCPGVALSLLLPVHRGQIFFLLIGMANTAIDLGVLLRMRHGCDVLMAHRALERAMHVFFEFLPRHMELPGFAIGARHRESFIAMATEANRLVGARSSSLRRLALGCSGVRGQRSRQSNYCDRCEQR